MKQCMKCGKEKFNFRFFKGFINVYPNKVWIYKRTYLCNVCADFIGRKAVTSFVEKELKKLNKEPNGETDKE